MKALLTIRGKSRIGRTSLVLALALGLPACQADQQRLAQLEATQQQQARELATLRRQLAEKEEEVAQLETCVDDLENAVYEDEGDSAAYDDDEAGGHRTTTL
jgi:septal ring factor EnvC (AmiA/AmiB activator)